MAFDDFVDVTYMPFYGVDMNRFKLFDFVFEAVENEDDGYRSFLDSVEVADPAGCIFFGEPITFVIVRRVREVNGFDGYDLVDSSGHTWLRLGTDCRDEYYPCFTFSYNPARVEGLAFSGGWTL